MLSACLLSLLILPIIGFTLSSAFEQKLARAIKNELSAYSYAILAVAEVEDSKLIMPEQLMENQFNVIESGLYSTITAFSNKTINDSNELTSPEYLWQSYSLFSLKPPEILPEPLVGESEFSEIQLGETKHFSFSLSVSFTSEFNIDHFDNVDNFEESELSEHELSDNEFSDNYPAKSGFSKSELLNNTSIEFPVTIHIIKDLRDFEEIVNQFQQQLWLWLSILMVLLLVIQIVWLRWTLKPLNTLQHELEQVEQGKRDQLQNKYPQELFQVTNQLNLLLKTEQSQRLRYRNALSDLAHSLKTPLAVINTQRDLSETSTQQLTVINRTIEHQLKRAQSAGESSWHLGVNIPNVLIKLINSLEKIYRDKEIDFSVTYNDIDSSLVNIVELGVITFKGDEADLFEILGNLLDNACKAAKQKVSIFISTIPAKNTNLNSNHPSTQTSTKINSQLTIVIADDGSGIDSTMQKNILQRGVRADTYQQGHGIGLAIVRDLVISYQGSINIDDSELLGGAEFTLTFDN